MKLKTIRFTSSFHNGGKEERILAIDQNVKILKNEISSYIFQNFDRILFDKKALLAEYKLFKIPDLSAWETQAIFQDILKLYENQLQKRKMNIDFRIQNGVVIETYLKKTRTKNRGDIKSFKIKTKKTPLCKVAKYLVFCDLNKPLPEAIIEPFKDKVWFPKLLRFVAQKQINLKKSMKLIQFQTGTFRKSPAEKSYIFKDETNARFTWWYRYKVGKEIINLPLQINKIYHKDMENLVRFLAECYIKVTNHKIHILTTREDQGYSFREFTEIVGIDINVKHNFCFLSDGTEVDYDRKWIGQAVKALKKLDGSNVKTETQNNRITKIARRNRWYFQNLIHKILDSLEAKGISDIVLEDLNLTFGATFIKHPDFEIKYSRLVRFLRLSSVKTWFIQQANKRGIRVHLTNPAYTSQTCPSCGSVSRENRKTQEIFLCVSCDYQENADLNAAKNIQRRISVDVLRESLHQVDTDGICSPRRLRKETIKKILEESVSSEM